MKSDKELADIIQRHVDAMVEECQPLTALEFERVLATSAAGALRRLVEDVGFDQTMSIVGHILAVIAPAGHHIEIQKGTPSELDA